jgi:hypothetical protein
MNTSPPHSPCADPGATRSLLRLLWILPLAAALGTAFGSDGLEAVAISAKVSPGYSREKLPSGSFRPETYAFGKGGLWAGTEAGTVEVADFMDVAKALAGPLAGQGFVSSSDPRATRLLIMVYWGTTRTPEHTTNSVASQNLAAANAAVLAANLDSHMVHFNPSDSCAPAQMQQGSQINQAVRTPAQIDMENVMTSAMAMEAAEDGQRLQIDAENASMLGYDSWWNETAQYVGTPLEIRRQDLLDEIEGRRYFVVLMAYDFQEMWKEKQPRLFWEARFSIREKGNELRKQLAAMAGAAAPYFGKDSGRLLHKPLPEGRVDVGPIREVADERRLEAAATAAVSQK